MPGTYQLLIEFIKEGLTLHQACDLLDEIDEAVEYFEEIMEEESSSFN